MKKGWKNTSTKTEQIYTRKTKNIKISVVLGHVLYKDEWILQTNPSLFKMNNVPLYMSRSASPEMVIEAAETIVKTRLTKMLEEIA